MKFLPGGCLMERKSLEIIRCTQCYHLAAGAYVSFCMHPVFEDACDEDASSLFDCKIKDVGYIPEWCPLEDWPNE